MSNPSATPPLFAQSAREILERLNGEDSPVANRIRDEAEVLLKEFLGWIDTPPQPTERLTAINKLFALYREMLDHRVKK